MNHSNKINLKSNFNQFNNTSQMNNLYQGGQCDPSAMASSNQFKTMMNALSVGGVNPQRVLQHAQKGVSFQAQIRERQAMFKAMNANWNQSQTTLSNMNKDLNAQWMQNESLVSNQMQHRQMQMAAQYEINMMERQQFEMMKQEEWRIAQQKMQMQQTMLEKEFENSQMMGEADAWTKQIVMENAVQNSQAEQERIINSSSSMLETMSHDPDPRFQNSQFLKFLARIKSKQIVIEGNNIREVNSQVMEGAWKEAEETSKAEQINLEGGFLQAQNKQQEQHMKAKEAMQRNWQQKLEDYQNQYADSENFQKLLQEKYMEVLKEMNLDLTDAWQSAADIEQNQVHGEIPKQYNFNPNNPFMDVAFPKKLALEMINVGKNNQAILAMEAHLNKNPTDADCWRVLGLILQQNDQDLKSIPCLMQCLAHDPNNTNALLSLGVGCTNILDEVKAMNYLKKWLMINPKYKVANIEHIIPEQFVNERTYKIEDIKAMNNSLIKVFEQVVKTAPPDPQLMTAFGILFFVKREYEVAIDLFKKALSLDPTNYHLMNKVGATLAHLGQTDQAVEYYSSALDIRPNYVRVWVNLGIAHSFKGIYPQAARFHLNALSFRPDANHVWSYVHSCFMAMGRYDLISKIAGQDSKAFKNQFDIIQVGDLPAAEISYNITTEKHILQQSAEEWVKEMQK